jgi:hypothetical protein
MRFGNVDPSRVAQHLDEAGMIHEEMDACQAIDGARRAGVESPHDRFGQTLVARHVAEPS